jgi:cupin 2 domain-containing protein
MANIFRLPSQLPSEELFESLFANNQVLIERIISTGQTTPPGKWYDQDRDEWVILLRDIQAPESNSGDSPSQGEAELRYEDNSRIKLTAGDYVSIPAHQKHLIEYTSSEPPCIWLAVYC